MSGNIEKYDLRGKTAEEVEVELKQMGFPVYVAGMRHMFEAFHPGPEKVQYVFLHHVKSSMPLPVFIIFDGSEHQARFGDALKLFHWGGKIYWTIGGTDAGNYSHLDI
jgi:hypothetical protein